MFGFEKPVFKPSADTSIAGVRRKPLRDGASSSERADAWIRSVLGEDYDHISGQPRALAEQVTRTQIDAYYRRKVPESIECAALPEETSLSSVPWFGSPLMTYLSLILRSTYQLTGENHALDSIAIRRYLSSTQFSLTSTVLPTTMPTNLHPKIDVHPLPSGAHLHIACQILMVLGNTHPNQVYCPILADLILVMLTFMTPAETFAIIEVMVRKSQKSELYFPTTSTRWMAIARAAALLLQKVSPLVSMHMTHLGVAPSQVIFLWLSRAFTGFLPIHAVHRLLDYFFLEGVYALVTICITILTIYQDVLVRTTTKAHFLRVLSQISLIDDVDGILKYCKQMNITKKLIVQYMGEVPQASQFGEVRGFKLPSFKNVNRTGKSMVLKDAADSNKFGQSGDKHMVEASKAIPAKAVTSTSGVVLSLSTKAPSPVWKGTCSEIQSYTDFLYIREWLPLQQRCQQMVLSYSTSLQGYSLQPLLALARNRPHILVVKHSKGVLGSFVQKWQSGLFFDGRAFVFTLEPFIKLYPLNKAALVNDDSDSDSDSDSSPEQKSAKKKPEVHVGELAKFVQSFEDKDVRDAIWYRSGAMDVFGDVSVGGLVFNNSKTAKETVGNAVPGALGYSPLYLLQDSPSQRSVGSDALSAHEAKLQALQDQYKLPSTALRRAPGSVVATVLANGPKAPMYIEQIRRGQTSPADNTDLPRYFFAFQEEDQPLLEETAQTDSEGAATHTPRSQEQLAVLCEKIEPQPTASFKTLDSNKITLTYKGYSVAHPYVTSLCLVPYSSCRDDSTKQYSIFEHTLDTHIPALGTRVCDDSLLFRDATSGKYNVVDLVMLSKKLLQIVLPSFKAIHTRAKVLGLSEQLVKSCAVPVGVGIRDDGFQFLQNDLDEHKQAMRGAYGSQHGQRVGEIIHPADTFFLHSTAARFVHAAASSVPFSVVPAVTGSSLAAVAVALSSNPAVTIAGAIVTQEEFLRSISAIYKQKDVTCLHGLQALLDQPVETVLDVGSTKLYCLGSDSVYDVCSKAVALNSRFIPIVHTELANVHPDQPLPTLPDVLESPIEDDLWSQIVPINTVHCIAEIDILYLLQTAVTIRTHLHPMHALLLPADNFLLQTYTDKLPELHTVAANTPFIDILNTVLAKNTHVYIVDAQGLPTHMVNMQVIIAALVRVFEKLTTTLPSTDISLALPAKQQTIRAHMICSEKQIGLGDSNGMAFLLDEHLQQGYSQATSLFSNPPLCGTDRFDIQAVELWTFTNDD